MQLSPTWVFLHCSLPAFGMAPGVCCLLTDAFVQEEIAAPIKHVAFARGNSVSFRVDPDVGDNEANA